MSDPDRLTSHDDKTFGRDTAGLIFRVIPESTELPGLLRWRSRLAPQRVAGRIEVLAGYLQTF